MASSFKGWGGSWGDSWGPIVVDPNAMYGNTSFSFLATGTLTSAGGVTPAEMSGSASFSITAVGALLQPSAPAETPRYSKAQADHAHWKQLREEDDVILALLQQFVMEEA
jgi:hypothetical protein